MFLYFGYQWEIMSEEIEDSILTIDDEEEEKQESVSDEDIAYWRNETLDLSDRLLYSITVDYSITTLYEKITVLAEAESFV